jgi:putative flippase GtrA
MLSPKLGRLVKHQTDNTFIQLLRYAFVGGLAFVVDFGSLYVLTDCLGVYYLHSAALAFLVGLTTNYLLSVLWVFQKRTFQNRFVEYMIFGLLGVLGLVLNQGLMYFLTEDVRCHYLFSKMLATGLVFLWNFGSRKLILFHIAPPGNPYASTVPLPAAPLVENVSATTQSLETTI